jgi:ADP-heptose:LPS heptosyltransferase
MSSLHFDLYLHSNMNYKYIYIYIYIHSTFQIGIVSTYMWYLLWQNFITFPKIQKMICLYHNSFPKFAFYNFCPKISILFPNSVLTLNFRVQKFATKRKRCMWSTAGFPMYLSHFHPPFQSDSIVFLFLKSQRFLFQKSTYK